jgi:hypothetical protein
MFLASSHPATALFDSGASHSFISSSFVVKHQLPITIMKQTMLVSSPGGEMRTKHILSVISITIRGVDLLANLIVLDSKGIDIILGMNWLRKYDGVILCAKRAIRLTREDGTIVEFNVAIQAEQVRLLNKVQGTSLNEIGMDFIVGLPCTQAGYDSIWVIVDRLTKVAYFIPVKTTYSGAKLTKLYMSRIVCLHGVPKNIVSDRGSQFTSKFWEKLHESMDTKLNFSSAYHPQTNGQTERTNQILEDMLRACALKYGKSWDKSLPYAEFSYNNSYQDSIKMVPYEALYGRQC